MPCTNGASSLIIQIIIDEQFFHHSFVYPDFSTEDAELQEYIAKDLLEISHKRALERSGEGGGEGEGGGFEVFHKGALEKIGV